MKHVLAAAVILFVGAAGAQLFMPRRLPDTLVYCACAWILAKTRQAI